jgi:hypothetical protein
LKAAQAGSVMHYADEPPRPVEMPRGPHQVTKDFEAALCEYTGARFAVAVNSCTSALLLAVKWHIERDTIPMDEKTLATLPYVVEIPKRTYVSVPQSIIHAGGPTFRDEDWIGSYQLKPYPIWDCARRFTGEHVHPRPDAVRFISCSEDSRGHAGRCHPAR